MKPDVAICDPELTLTLPPRLTAATGMDAFGHCLEGYLSVNVNPPAEAIALDGIARVCRWVARATENGADREARWHMLMAALEGGMAIYMGLGPVHVLGHVFADSPLHHGALITASAPAVVRFYADAGDKALDDRLARIGEAMGLGPGADVAGAIDGMNARLGLEPSVRALGYRANDLDALADYAAGVHFNASAPRVPTREEYRAMIAEVLG